MATDADLERIALALPGVELGTFWGGPAYVVAGKAIANRREPRRDVGAVDPRTDEPYDDLIVVHLGGREAKAEALATFDPDVVFTSRTSTARLPCWRTSTGSPWLTWRTSSTWRGPAGPPSGWLPSGTPTEGSVGLAQPAG